MLSAPELSDDELVEEVAEELARELKRLVYPREFFDRLRSLAAPSEKLVYLYIWLCQPQTFSSIKRCLNLPGRSVARAVKKLKAKGLIFEDESFLYWTDKPSGEKLDKRIRNSCAHNHLTSSST